MNTQKETILIDIDNLFSIKEAANFASLHINKNVTTSGNYGQIFNLLIINCL